MTTASKLLSFLFKKSLSKKAFEKTTVFFKYFLDLTSKVRCFQFILHLTNFKKVISSTVFIVDYCSIYEIDNLENQFGRFHLLLPSKMYAKELPKKCDINKNLNNILTRQFISLLSFTGHSITYMNTLSMLVLASLELMNGNLGHQSIFLTKQHCPQILFKEIVRFSTISRLIIK